jgi:hypothetical protein
LADTAALWQIIGAWTDAELAHAANASDRSATIVQQTRDALSSGPAWRTRMYALYIFSRLGDARLSAHAVDELKKNHPLDTLVNSYWLPVGQALTELRRSNAQGAASALAALQPADALDLGDPKWSGMFLPYVRGEALMIAHKPREAVVEFQKLVDHPGAASNCPLAAYARLGIARGFAQAGEKEESRAAYEDLFVLWKNADADFPLLLQAKSEYAKLK